MEVPASRRAFAHPGAWGLAVALLAALGFCLHALAPTTPAGALVMGFCWMAMPGVLIARRLYGAHRRPWIPALLMGPAWGFASSSVAVLALWMSGVRHWALL